MVFETLAARKEGPLSFVKIAAPAMKHDSRVPMLDDSSDSQILKEESFL